MFFMEFGYCMAGSTTVPGVRRYVKPCIALPGRLVSGVARIADYDCPVLIAGERGAGKRAIARRIHSMSRRSRGTYTEMESANASEQALSAIFSTQGTLYLSEVADLSGNLQDWLVNAYLHPDCSQYCRLICGTGRELLDEVRDRHMREDFYYFISTVTLRIAPLRFRKAEILAIADELLTHYSRQFDRPKPVLSEEIAGFLMEHSWPGNLTELETAMKAVAAIDDQAVSLAALKAAAAKPTANRCVQPLKQAARVASTQIERRMISEVMAATGGNRKRAADELGISYKALLYKLKQAGIDSVRASNRTGVGR